MTTKEGNLIVGAAAVLVVASLGLIVAIVWTCGVKF